MKFYPIYGNGRYRPKLSLDICQSLDREVAAYHRRTSEDHYLYLFFDGISMKVKGASQVHKKQILVAYGITLEGKKEIIEFRQSSS